MPKKTVSFLASGRGSNFTAVAEKIISGEIKVNLGILIVDKEDAKAIQVAEKYKMKAYFIDPKKYTGCTAHFIDEGTDTGAIILQSVVAVDNDDTLKTLSIKILKEEHQILPKAVNLFCKDKLIVEGRKVIIKK